MQRPSLDQNQRPVEKLMCNVMLLHVDMLVNYSWLNRCMRYLGLACHEQMKWDSPSLIKPCVDVRQCSDKGVGGYL